MTISNSLQNSSNLLSLVGGHEGCVLAPSLLAADFGEVARAIKAVEQADIKLLHLDVMDGQFVPNISFGASMVAACRKVSDLLLDVHLMIVSPERYIDMFVEAGANYITVHAEACVHLHRVLTQIRDAGVGVGLAVNPLTPLEVVRDALPYVDMVLIMSVNPGFGGQSYIEDTSARVSQVRQWITAGNYDCVIEVDGGINQETIAKAAQAGANICVAGSAIFKVSQSKTQGEEQAKDALEQTIFHNIENLRKQLAVI